LLSLRLLHADAPNGLLEDPAAHLVRGWEHEAQVAAATAWCSPPRERWEIFQVKIRAAGAATQLVEYETGVEIDSVFFQQRQIFLFEGHLPIDVPSGNGCTSPPPGDSIRSRHTL